MAILIKPNGTKSWVRPANGKEFELEEIQALVGGYIEIISLNESEVMVVNEEGKLLGLPINRKASQKAWRSRAIALSDYVVGDVVICGVNQV